MRNFLKFLIFGILSVVFCSCEKDKKVDPTPTQEPTFNEVLSKEYANLVKIAPNTVFYETMMVLDTAVETGTLKVANYVNVYQCGEYNKQCFHPGDSTVTVKDFWCEDVKIEPDSLKLTLEQAWDRLYQADIVKPKYILKVSLRNPLGPIVGNPMYIFGQGAQFIAVDAITGDVKEIK